MCFWFDLIWFAYMIGLGLQSIGLKHQFDNQHYSHPAVDSRVVISAMTITDSKPATGQRTTFCESQRVLHDVTTLSPPPPPSSRIVTLVWTPPSPFNVTSFMDDPNDDTLQLNTCRRQPACMCAINCWVTTSVVLDHKYVWSRSRHRHGLARPNTLYRQY